MELFVIVIDGFQPLTIITKCSILDVAAVLDPPLQWIEKNFLMNPLNLDNAMIRDSLTLNVEKLYIKLKT